jgi:hypothetical protein
MGQKALKYVELKKFNKTDYQHYPGVEDLCGEIVPMIAKVKMKMRPPDYEGLFATVVVDGNGILVMIYDKDGQQRMVFCRKLDPFPLAVFVAQHLEEPLDPEVLTKFGFERFK